MNTSNLIDAIKLKKYYMEWLNKEITINKIGNFLEITSPFLDRYNDYLQVYINITNNNDIYLTDDGYIINNLKMSGIDVDSPKRKELINTFLRKYGVNLSNEEIYTECSYNDFPEKLMFLMQAMLKIDDVFMLSKNKVLSLFNEDIEKFFKENDIYYSANVNFIGKSGLYYSYDYLLQRTKNKPERLCKVITNPTIQNFKNNAFMWNDTKETRNDDSQFIVLLNDKTPIPPNILSGYENYDIKTILWSEKDEKIDLLTA